MASESLRNLKILFLGTPDFAATILSKLINWPQGKILGVVTQPNKPVGRGKKIKFPAVKILADQIGLQTIQPENISDPQTVNYLESLAPDVIIVAAYGQILPRKILNIAPYGAINVHASLLPKYRGASPIQRALLNGERVTGISIMQMEKGMDSGSILLQRALAIDIQDTSETLHDQLAELGGELLVEALERLLQGALIAIPQDSQHVTYAPKVTKKEGQVNWDQPCIGVHNQIRAMYPWPGAYFDWKRPFDQKVIRLQIYPGYIGDKIDEKIQPGTIVGIKEENIAIACADRLYLVPTIKPASGKPLDARSFYCGYLE